MGWNDSGKGISTDQEQRSKASLCYESRPDSLTHTQHDLYFSVDGDKDFPLVFSRHRIKLDSKPY